MNHYAVQKIAKETMAFIRSEIHAGMQLQDVRAMCEEKMRSLGADSFWYWDVGAFVFSGDETALSVSGRNYAVSNRVIGSSDIVTIDLSPQRGCVWGDYARTIILEDGKVVSDAGKVQNAEWRSDLLMEERLHAELRRFATPETTFEELHDHMNALIIAEGFVNLDFLGNLGHSIASRREDRIYIEKGNTRRLGDAKYFTFEPHISIPESRYGFKREDIYYFDGNQLVVL